MFDTALQQGSGWQAAHEALTRLARARAGLDFEEGEKLRVAERARVHERLGYGSFVEYIERLFGYSPRLTLEKLRVAEALDGLPQLAAALREGNASWSSVRELTRVATRATEHDWLEASRGRTVREVEKLVSGHRPGDLPGGAKDWRAERHVLRFEVTGEVLASFREALAKLRRDAGGPLDDDATLLLMARHVLGGPTDDGRASYQVALTLCEACARATQAGLGQALQVSAEVAKMASCDAQHIKPAHPQLRVSSWQLAVGSFEKSRPSRRRKNCELPTANFQLSHHQRASQTIPPSVRRAVLLRDQHCCQVPGCRHATFVDVHHLRAREDGGSHEPDNLLTLCGAHHRACHRGELLIEKSVSGALDFWHADGTTYGGRPSTGEADVAARTFRGLRNLGFGEKEAREAVREAAAHVGNDGGVESLMRTALERLTRNGWEKAS
jgi:5-methylcytosine-specific restriction endonuclease McrA